MENEGDVCGLDIYLYNRQEEELFVHHDYFLPAFPLALEWLDYNAQVPSNSKISIQQSHPTNGAHFCLISTGLISIIFDSFLPLEVDPIPSRDCLTFDPIQKYPIFQNTQRHNNKLITSDLSVQ